MSYDDNERSSCTKRKKGVKRGVYKHEKIKKARILNQEYENYSGKITKPKPHGFTCDCKHQCIPNLISLDESEAIYQSFISLGSKNEQDFYLYSNIVRNPVKRRRVRGEERQKRTASFVYRVNKAGKGTVEICKKAFLSLYGTSGDRVRRLCNLLKDGSLPEDKRGFKIPGNAKPLNIVGEIISHINSFPVNVAHYTAEKVQYFSADLTVKKMWELFIEKFPHYRSEVKYSFYFNIFKKHFDLKFYPPPIDDSSVTCVVEEQNEYSVDEKHEYYQEKIKTEKTDKSEGTSQDI